MARLGAYNARDIEAFMSGWAEDAQYFEPPNALLTSGAEQIRARRITRFRKPDLYGHLLTRTVLGNREVDHGQVARNFPRDVGDRWG
ncbi:nuclear transport factor 2 family protein [Deinococcus hopiensis]|uniref:nuclear transport factor 2 family protein n=1 Tax=Deinococcus hopiensis TaxID=309885 RepID=UPI001BB01E33|nr:nuclear transport factor 2 family protein [Deinococcus hopiensis]